MPTSTLPELTREDYLAMLRSDDSPEHLEWKISPSGIIDNDADNGILTVVIAVTGIVDEVDDIIIPGAFADSLQARIPKGVWSHDIHTWVSRTDGIGELAPGDSRLPKDWKGKPWPKDAGALIVRTAFNLGTNAGRDAYSNVVFFDAGPLGAQTEFCADEDTEILTGEGWKRYDQLRADDEAYALDPETLTARFEPIQTVNVFPRKVRRMRLIETGGYSSLTTEGHRWPVLHTEDGHGSLRWRRTDNLDYRHRLFRTAPHIDSASTPKFSDEFVELVAWFWTEGWTAGKHGRFAFIGQSHEKNPTKCADVRRALTRFPGDWSEQRRAATRMTHWRLKRNLSDAIFNVTGLDKAPEPWFLRALTVAQLRLLIERCLDGDGHRTEAGQRTFYQASEHGTRTFEMACALAGIPTNTRHDRWYPGMFGEPREKWGYAVSLLTNGVAKPLDAIRVTTRYTAEKPKRTKAVDEWVQHDGIVWCPTTPSGTWLARRNGTVYFTGNSIGYNSIPAFTKRNRYGQRELYRVDLFEYGPVIFGAMPLCGVIGTKARKFALEHKGALVSQSTILGNLGNLELKVAGKEVTPKDAAATEKLKQYWEHGAGAAKIRWGEPGDFDRCVTELSKYLPPGQVKGYCANRHKGATGGWPGHAPGVEEAEAQAKKAEKKEAGDMDALDQGRALLDSLEGKAAPATLDKPVADDPEVARAALEALGLSDDEIEQALADEPEFTAVPDDLEPPEGTKPEDEAAGDGADLSPDDGDPAGDAELRVTTPEGRVAKFAGELAEGDHVYDVQAAEGSALVSGEIKSVSVRGSATRVSVLAGTETKTLWLRSDQRVRTAYDPLAELKSGLSLLLERKDYPNLAGSVEERQGEIREAVRELMLPEPDDNGNVRAWVSLVATFADYVVVSYCDYSQGGPDSEDQTFVVPYTMGDDGSVELGQPAPVDRQVVLVPRAAEDTAEEQPAGGMNPSMQLARKLYDGAKALLEAVESKAAAGEPLDGIHARRFRDANEAMTGALAGLGTEAPTPDAMESKALLGEAALLLGRASAL